MKTYLIRPVLMFSRDDLVKLQEKMGRQISLGRIEEIWQRMQQVIRPAAYYCLFDDAHAEAAVTLGAETDRFLASLAGQGEYSSVLIGDQLCMQLLHQLYQLLEDVIADAPEKSFTYAFPESASVIGSILAHTGAKIELTAAGMMYPLKSAAYLLYPADDEAGEDCTGICGSCSNRRCPYGQKPEKKQIGAFRYSYGYQRIFGTMPKDEKGVDSDDKDSIS